MPLCNKCREFMPPDLCEDQGNSHICCFCKLGMNQVWFNGQELTKQFAIDDYKKFLAEFAKNPNVQRLSKLGDIASSYEINIKPNKD